MKNNIFPEEFKAMVLSFKKNLNDKQQSIKTLGLKNNKVIKSTGDAKMSYMLVTFKVGANNFISKKPLHSRELVINL